MSAAPLRRRAPGPLCVEFDRVWKKFRRGVVHDSLRDLVPAVARSLFGGGAPRDALGQREFWALQDVTFRVEPGEALGIIGPNGAGKSTILKLLTGILAPTRGRAVVQGRVGALIELAAGFHPDLTGRENVFLQGAIMGMRRAEIARAFDRIVAFAGISDFIDTQVKRYSSGMQARLGFAIAAHLDPEVLIIDEILAVGDRGFQRKAFQRLAEIARRDIPVVVVSHQLDRVAELCTKAVLLNRGRVVHAGSADACIARYVEEGLGVDGAGLPWEHLRLDGFDLESDLPVASGHAVRATLRGHLEAPLRPAESLFVRVRDAESGDPLYGVLTVPGGEGLPARGGFALDIELEANVPGGLYLLEACLWDDEQRHEASPSLRRMFHVREDHGFHGSVNLHARFDVRAEPATGEAASAGAAGDA